MAKALGDPIRMQLVDVLRKHAGKVCVCELVPLFDLSQPTVSHHLKVLREAGIVGSERQGLWAYYYVNPDSIEELSAWLRTDRQDEIGEAVRERMRPRRAPSRGAQVAAALAGRDGKLRPGSRVLRRCAAITSGGDENFGAGPLSGARPRASSPTPPSSPRSAAATRPRSPSCTRARRCSTSAPAEGIDVLLSARRVGASGKAYGLDMTDEMLELARRNQREAGVENVEFLKGDDRSRSRCPTTRST